MRKNISIILLFFSCSAFAQSNLVDQYKDTLNSLARKMQRGENDSVRFAAGNSFHYFFEQLLNDSNSFTASFDSVKNVSVKTSPDQVFRIYTWTFPDENGIYGYYGYLQTVDKKRKKMSVIPLRDSSSVIEKPLSKKLKSERWYGAVYYDILESTRNGKKYYILFGWHGRDQHSTQKLLDVLSFQSGVPVFGLPVFKTKDIYNHRVIFEYTSQATMTLRYVPKNKLIVFDHLASTNKKNEPRLSRMTGPDGSYDAFKPVKGSWVLIENVDADNDFVPVKTDNKIFKDSELEKMNPGNKGD
jgi:hypothetical protein